ncbi:hypothetical protein [Thermococcus sp. 21S9]|uniref:hypothetical protein n=1 Tax=Thermococcus sp. 21S9 TaxID=1638223 RepID=UPI00143977F4|nr:hypothetical protein [Thermococcus sp. 21S9]NJE54805.1 hypothetical protein [Thermococcus sp. 21S9]
MGVDTYVYLVFDKKPEEVEDFLKREFKVEVRDEEFGDARMDYLRGKGLLGEDFQLITSGELLFDPPLRTDDGETIVDADFRIYTVKGYTILEIHPNPRSWWWFVLSSEVIRLLKQFMKAEPLLICGYRDDTDLTELGFEQDMSYLLINLLPETIKNRKLEILPSGLTVVKKELLGIEDGLYELIERPRREEKEYVLVKTLDNYKVLVSIEEIDLTDEECYSDILEDKALFSLKIVGLTFKRIGRKVEDEFLIKRAEEYFKAQVGEDGR